VLRSYSPMRTIGGGRVLDVSGTRRRRFRRDDLAALRVAEEGTRRTGCAAGSRAGRSGLPEADLTQQLGQPPRDRGGRAIAAGRRGLRRVAAPLVEEGAFRSAGELLSRYILEARRRNPCATGP